MGYHYRRVFVLGNGFDLAHYLPTQYIHFMEAMKVVEDLYVPQDLYFNDIFQYRIQSNDSFFQNTSKLYETEKLFISLADVHILREKLKNNFWYLHFKNHLSDVVTWIDFESEIENALLDFAKIFSESFDELTVSNFNGLAEIPHDSIKFISNDFWNDFGAKGKMYRVFFRDLNIAVSTGEESLNDIIEEIYLKMYGNAYLSFNEDEVFKKLSNALDDFKIIFQKYISLVINKLEPKVPFKAFGDLGKEIEAVFTFNYSNTFERFYPNSLPTAMEIQYIHGSAEAENIVLGISDLTCELKEYKIYNFVKSYQSIIQETDYKEIIELGDYLQPRQQEKIELLIWGHSLDISDKKYILEMLDSNNEAKWESHVWCFDRPHAYLANLMNILGEASVLKKIKNSNINIRNEAPNILEY